MFWRGLIIILLSIVCGGLFNYLIMSYGVRSGIIGVRIGGWIPFADEIFFLAAQTIFGGVFGFFTAVVLLALHANGFIKIQKYYQIIIYTFVTGLIAGVLTALRDYSRGIAGVPEGNQESYRFFLIKVGKISLLEFIAGCLIGLTVILAIKYIMRDSHLTEKKREFLR